MFSHYLLMYETIKTNIHLGDKYAVQNFGGRVIERLMRLRTRLIKRVN